MNTLPRPRRPAPSNRSARRRSAVLQQGRPKLRAPVRVHGAPATTPPRRGFVSAAKNAPWMEGTVAHKTGFISFSLL